MKFRLFRQEEGSVAVIVAITMTVLLGMTSLAVDFGMMAATRQSLQNAADAAALAGAADLGTGKSFTTVRETVETYCDLNGFALDRDDISHEVKVLGKTITVSLTQTMPMGFSSVLTGRRTRPVSAAATAEAISIFGGCPYAMFAGQRIEDDGSGIAISGNDIQINGNIHSNSDISMQHAVLGPGVVATAVRTVNPSTNGWNSNSIALDMPSFHSFESALSGMPGLVEFSGNIVKNSRDGFQALIDEALEQYRNRMGGSTGYLYSGLFIHIAGNLTFNGHKSTVYQAQFPITLVVDGDINLNGAPISSTYDFPVAIMSKYGDLTVNGGGASYTGILYAPKGDIILNGNDAAFVGSIVGQNIRKTGGKTVVRYLEDVDRFLPTTKVHLIA